MRRACLVAFALALIPGAATAAPPDAGRAGGYNLFDVFIEACVDNAWSAAPAVEALVARGAEVARTHQGMTTLKWPARGARLMVMMADGFCVVGSDAADRTTSMTAFLASSPEGGVVLPAEEAGLPDGAAYLGGFEARIPREQGRVTAVRFVAYQHGRGQPLLSFSRVFGPAPPDPSPSPAAPGLALNSADGVVSLFDRACFQGGGAQWPAANVVLAHAPRWVESGDPQMLLYRVGAVEHAVTVTMMPGYCAVATAFLSAPALERATQAWLGTLPGMAPIPPGRVPATPDATTVLAAGGLAPGDASGRRVVVSLLSMPTRGGATMDMLVLHPPFPDAP